MRSAVFCLVSVVGVSLGLASMSCATAHQELRAGCFEAHLHEAIALNEERRALYASWSDGASTALSDQLIASERALVPLAWAFDSLETSDPSVGLVGLCDVFEPMSAAPRPTRGAAPVARDDDQTPDAAALAEALHGALEGDGFAAVATQAGAALDGVPVRFCMTRHVLESVVRAAHVATLHEQQAREAGRTPATRRHRALVAVHLEGLEGAARLDAEAAPLHAEGIPILCADVPPIAPLPARASSRR